MRAARKTREGCGKSRLPPRLPDLLAPPHAVAAVDPGAVPAAAAVHPVALAVARVDAVPAGSAEQPVLPLAADQDVIPAGAVQRIVAGAAVEVVVAVLARLRGEPVRGDPARQWPCRRDLAACVTPQRVVPRQAVHRVVPAKSADEIGARRPVEEVVSVSRP